MPHGSKLNLRAAYTVPEIAALFGWSTRRARRMLQKLGILRQPGGPRSSYYVYLGDLKRENPVLWESLMDANAA